MAGKKKLYLIGIDSAPLWIIKDLYRKHGMDGFGAFFENGVLKNMKSTLPPLTPVAWPSIYTGLEPGEHGVMDFFCIDKEYTKQLLYFDAEANRTFWDIAAGRGLKSLIVTPPDVLKISNNRNVDMVTGWPLPPRFSSKALEDAARKAGFEGEPSIEKELQDGKILPDEASRRYVASTESRSEMSKKLIESNDYDIVFVCFTETDRIQHYSLNKPYWESCTAPVYKGISDFLEWVMDYTKRKNEQSLIMLVSDHGAQPIHLKFLLNAWLVNSGYATLKPEIMEQYKNPPQDGKAKGSAKYKLREMMLKNNARKIVYDKLPASAKRLTGKFMGSAFASASGGEYTRIHDFDFEMGKTVAFTSVSNDPVGMIWINDDRFSKPTVQKKDKERLKKEIIDGLETLKDAEGEKLITAIYDGDEYYKGTKHFIAPDLLLAVRDGYMIDVKNYSVTKAFMEPEQAKSGDHTMNGIFGVIANNYDLGKDAHDDKDTDVYSVKPMIMKFFDLAR